MTIYGWRRGNRKQKQKTPLTRTWFDVHS
jgi:hypothetical protein